MKNNVYSNVEDDRCSKYLRHFTVCTIFICLYFLIIVSFNEVIAQTLNTETPQENFILTKEEQIWVSEHPVIKVTNQMDWPPFDFVIAGEPAGYSIDYLNLLAEKIDFKIEYVNGYRWDELSDQLENKQIDVTHSIVQSLDREKFLEFTSPYIELPIVYFGRSGSAPIEKMDDLANKKIGVIKGFAHAEIYQRRYPNFHLVEQKNIQEALISVSAGTIDVVSVTLPIANYIITKNFIPGLEVLGREKLPEITDKIILRLGVRNDWPELIAILEKGKAAISERELNELSITWQNKYDDNTQVELTSEERAWLSQNNIINVAVDPTISPLEVIEPDQTISGISGSYLAKIEEKLDVKFVWVGNNNWTEGVEKFNAGEADMFSAVVSTPERRRFLKFTDPYLSLTNVIFALGGGKIFGNMAGLSGYTISQVEGFSVTSFIRQDYPSIKVIEVKTVHDALELVLNGGGGGGGVGGVQLMHMLVI